MSNSSHTHQNKQNQPQPKTNTIQEEQINGADYNQAARIEHVNPNNISPKTVLQLQTQYGNRATKQFLGHSSSPSVQRKQAAASSSKSSSLSFGGLMDVPEDDAQHFVGGAQINRTIGESVGDFFRPIGTGVGNMVGSVAGALSGISISSTNNTGPTWNDHGHFDWRVGFSTTGTSGWIVQEITNTYRAEDNTGTDITGTGVVPHYWEAWAVDGSSAITPAVGANNDYWIRPSKGANTKGHWSMEGKVHFTKDDPATHGFTAGGVSNAGILLSATSSGGMDLGIARLHRYAQGTWDSTGTTPTHTGSAR